MTDLPYDQRYNGRFFFGNENRDGYECVPIGADGASVAWEAHIGGFLAGFLGFALFDRPDHAAQ